MSSTYIFDGVIFDPAIFDADTEVVVPSGNIITLGLGTTHLITQGYFSGTSVKLGILDGILVNMEKSRSFSVWEPGVWEPGLMNENAPMRDQLRRLEH